MIKGKKNSKSEDRATGKYRRKEPPPQVAGNFYILKPNCGLAISKSTNHLPLVVGESSFLFIRTNPHLLKKLWCLDVANVLVNSFVVC